MTADLPAISLGKRRGLLQCADKTGVFNILALDHRQALYKSLQAMHGQENLYNQAVLFKQQVIRALASEATAFLLDPVLGAGPVLAADALPGTTGLVVSVEESGYAGPASARVSRLPEAWDCGKIKRMGASAAKLLVYYHPASPTVGAMRELIQRVAEDCRRLDLPLFLELLTYSPDPEQKELSAAGRREAVIRSAEELSALGADILKMEFPVDVRRVPDENVWSEACRELTAASRVPWVLLSAAVDFEVFQRQTEIACQAGASGVLAGRAIWKESVEAGPEQRMDFLCGTGLERLRLLGETCRKYARPYPGLFAPAAAPEDWQASYAGL